MTDGIHPAPTEFTDAQLEENPILRYFHYGHLPAGLREISEAFCTLAGFVVTALPHNAERSVSLRKLLEAKDAGARANVGNLVEAGHYVPTPEEIEESFPGTYSSTEGPDKMKTWECKIGEIPNALLPKGADAPMRQAVERAYEELTGRSPDFILSGWGAELTRDEREAVNPPKASTDTFVDAGDDAEVRVTGGGSSEDPVPFKS